MKLKFLILLKFGLVLVLLPISCQSRTESVTMSKAPVTPTVPAQAILSPTTTVAISVEITSNPVIIPSPSTITSLETATLTPTALVIPTLVEPTLTPLPTFSAEALDTAIAELLANPMNCDVPCWWGAIPGETRIEEIKHAISPYNFDISEAEENGEVYYLLLGIGYIEEQNDYEIKIVYNFANSILTGVTAYSPSISEFLTKYGQPDEIRLLVKNDPRLTNPTVWLQIVYLQKGMAVGYITDMFFQNDKIAGCFAGIERGRLRLLAPDLVTYYKDFTPIFEADRLYLPLEEATELTIEDFMQRFTDTTQPQCIETPAELWE